MLLGIITEPYRPWFRMGFAVGVLLGTAAGIYLDWYFTHGPGAGGIDAGEVHGYLAMTLGFPVSLLLIPVATLVPWGARFWAPVGSIALSWGLIGATLACLAGLVVRRFRSAT